MMATRSELQYERPGGVRSRRGGFWRGRVGRVVLMTLLVLGVAGGWIGYRVVYTLRGLPDAYAMWDTGTLLVEYMKSHENRWPGGWDDLGETYERLASGKIGNEHIHGGMTLEQLRERVSVDWQADTGKLA